MKATTVQLPSLISVAQAAEYLSCSVGHVHNLIAAGHFRRVDIRATGSRPKTRLYADDVRAYVEQHTQRGAAS